MYRLATRIRVILTLNIIDIPPLTIIMTSLVFSQSKETGKVCRRAIMINTRQYHIIERRTTRAAK